MTHIRRFFVCLMASLSVSLASGAYAAEPAASKLKGMHVLVFAKTAGFRHDSIPTGKATFETLARDNGFTVTVTEDAAVFTEDGLKAYNAIVFLNTTGDVLDPAQQTAFEGYIRAGGGLLGVHSATDTEHDGTWPWFVKLIGANFKSHPAQAEARLVVSDPTFPAIAADPALVATGHLHITDEWYDFENVSATLSPVLKIDGASYPGALSQALNPMVWSNRFDGGRAFYIGLGHRDDVYAAPLMQRLMIEGLIFAADGA